MFLHTDAFTRTLLHTDHVYTQTLLHTDLFTDRSCFYTQTLWHTEAFTHRRFYTQVLLHTNTFTHKHFYTQTLLHTDAFTRRRLYTQKLLHTNTFTQKHFDTTDAFTHRRLYTQALLHTITCTHRRFYTEAGPGSHSEVIVVVATSAIRRGGVAKSLFPCASKPACINMSCGLCALGPPNQGGLPSPEKKSINGRDLAGSDRFWAGTRTVLQYDRSWFFMGLGSWLLTVTGMETLILTLIHPSLYIKSHTSIFISYLYLYLNIKYIDLFLCGSSLSR